MRRVLWVCGLSLIVACGSTRKRPKADGTDGGTGGVGAGAAGNAGGDTSSENGGEPNGDPVGGGAAGGASGAEELSPAPVKPLLPEDDVTASIDCPGPSPLEHWQFPSAPQPHAVLAIDPKSSTTFYGQLTSVPPTGASSQFPAWLLRTDDGGGTWCQLDLPEALHELVVSPADRRVLYAAGATHYYRSDDFGNTWQERAAVGRGRLVPHETQVDTLYELGATIRRSVDGGASWEAAKGGQPVQEVAFAEDGREILYGVSKPCHLNRSSDWGQTWQKFRIADSCLETAAAAPSRPLLVSSGLIYLTERVDGQTVIHYSSDNGEHWARTEALSFEVGELLAFRGDESGVVYQRDGSALQRSTDGGQTWSEHLTVPDGGWVSTLGPRSGVFHARESRDLSLLSVDDGEQWTTTAVVRDGTVHTAREDDPLSVYIAGAHWLYRSVDGGKSFESLAWPDKATSPRPLVVARYDRRQLATKAGDRWVLSTSSGTTWLPWEPNIDGVERPAFFQSLTFAPASPSDWYATLPDGPHVLASNTAGGWFQSMSTSTSAREVVPAFDRWVVYALGGDLGAPVLSRSDDGGRIWKDPCRPPDVCPTSLQVHPTSPLVVVGAGADATSGVAQTVLMSSKDGGLTWTKQVVAAGAWRTFFSVSQNPSAWSLLDHAYRSDDLGVTWSQFSVPVAGEVARDYSSPEGMFVNNGGLWRYLR